MFIEIKDYILNIDDITCAQIYDQTRTLVYFRGAPKSIVCDFTLKELIETIKRGLADELH